MSIVNVIGLGYIGLPTALMLAKNNVKVYGTDINAKLIDSLTKGSLTFKENGLLELFEDARHNGIVFTTEYIKTDFYIIAVPTPYIESNKKLDPSFVVSAMNSVLNVCMQGSTVVIESTIAPGTIDKYIKPLVTNRGLIVGKDVFIAHAPERIIPGNMIFELVNNSRTIGADDMLTGEKVKNVYSCFCKSNIVLTDIRSAEMSKVVENTFRDINIAYANELAKICRADNLDVYEIIRIANMHPRVNILQPGPGVGGHCISVDPWFLVGDYPSLTKLILAAREVNDSMPLHVISRMQKIMKENHIKDLGKVGVYGLTYKENIDDTRESPALQLLDYMEENLAFGLKSYDPFLTHQITANQVLDFDDFLNSIDFVVIITAHDHIKNNLGKLRGKIILDTRNVCNSEKVYKL